MVSPPSKTRVEEFVFMKPETIVQPNKILSTKTENNKIVATSRAVENCTAPNFQGPPQAPPALCCPSVGAVRADGYTTAGVEYTCTKCTDSRRGATIAIISVVLLAAVVSAVASCCFTHRLSRSSENTSDEQKFCQARVDQGQLAFETLEGGTDSGDYCRVVENIYPGR